MTGILLVTHPNLGEALIETIELISGQKEENLTFVSVDIREDPDKLRKRIQKGLSEIKTEQGTIILTDMFGGTPSNLSYSFLEEGYIEVISGVNLPILFKAVNSRKRMNINELKQALVEHGKKSISLASNILNGTKQ
jgi:mannose PTS system EIIA component